MATEGGGGLEPPESAAERKAGYSKATRSPPAHPLATEPGTPVRFTFRTPGGTRTLTPFPGHRFLRPARLHSATSALVSAEAKRWIHSNSLRVNREQPFGCPAESERLTGVEPATPTLATSCSDQLSYNRMTGRYGRSILNLAYRTSAMSVALPQLEPGSGTQSRPW
jgi:hypothetical protein